MSDKLPTALRVMLHWYKHAMAETSGRPVRTLDGQLEEYGDPDDCDVCIAITVGMEFPTPEALLVVTESSLKRLLEEARRRGLTPGERT